MKKYWFLFLLSLLLLAPFSKNLNAQTTSSPSQPNQSYWVTILIWNLPGILTGIAGIITASITGYVSLKKVEEVKRASVEAKINSVDNNEKIQEIQGILQRILSPSNQDEEHELNLLFKEALLKEGTDFRQELEQVIQRIQANTTLGLFKQFVDDHIQQGKDLFSNHQYQEAINSYKEALKFQPESSYILYNIGNAYAGNSSYEEAIIYYEKAINSQPVNEWLWHSWGDALIKLNRFNEAVEKYDKAKDISSNLQNLPEHWYKRGNALAGAGKYEDAIASYERAIEFNRNDFRFWHSKGDALRKSHQYEKAINSYEEALKIQRDNNESLHKLGKAYSGLGDYYLKLNNSQKAHDNYIQARACYSQLIGRQYTPASVLFNLGYVLSKLGHSEEATQSYEQAINICQRNWTNSNHKDYGALYDEARCYALKGNVALANNLLKQAINLNDRCREGAKVDSEFDGIREDHNFQLLLNS